MSYEFQSVLYLQSWLFTNFSYQFQHLFVYQCSEQCYFTQVSSANVLGCSPLWFCSEIIHFDPSSLVVGRWRSAVFDRIWSATTSQLWHVNLLFCVEQEPRSSTKKCHRKMSRCLQNQADVFSTSWCWRHTQATNIVFEFLWSHVCRMQGCLSLKWFLQKDDLHFASLIQVVN